jgi:protein-tyrosine phosphatase
MLDKTSSIICAFGLASAAPRSPYRHLELCGIANKITDYSNIAASRCLKGYDGMTKILFVCHGNICRSPMAEYVMKDLVRQSGQEDEFVIASAATSREELGNPVYPPARRKLAEHGIRCDGHAARQMTRKDYEEFGYLIGMDRMNLSNMARICGGDPEGKCSLLLAHAGQSGDVADPWYTGDFEATWQDVNIGCRALLKELTEKK